MTFFGNFSSNESIIFTNGATKSVTGNSITLRGFLFPSVLNYTRAALIHICGIKELVGNLWHVTTTTSSKPYKASRIRDRAIIKLNLIRDQTDCLLGKCYNINSICPVFAASHLRPIVMAV